MNGQNSSPKISTVICNYNYRDFVISSVNSALAQDYPNHEVILVDDGSTDDSWELIQKNFPAESFCTKMVLGKPVQIHRHKNLYYLKIENSGASVARNAGISLCKSSDGIMILDSDDMAVNNKVSRLANKLFEYDEIGVVYADYFIQRREYRKQELKLPYSGRELGKQCIVHSGALIKKKYLDMVAPTGEYYNPELHGPASKGFIGATEDYCLWLQLAKVCMIVHIPEFLTLVNEHGKNQSMRMTNKIFNNNLRKFNV
jgi:glycosyltransferase involved in cell wall biosynthesis